MYEFAEVVVTDTPVVSRFSVANYYVLYLSCTALQHCSKIRLVIVIDLFV